MFKRANKTHFSLSVEGLASGLQILALKGHAGISQPFRFDLDLQGLPHKQAFLALASPEQRHSRADPTHAPSCRAHPPIPVCKDCLTKAKFKSHRLKERDVYISAVQGRALHAPVIAWHWLDRDHRAQHQLGHCSLHNQAPTVENLMLDPMQVTALGGRAEARHYRREQDTTAHDYGMNSHQSLIRHLFNSQRRVLGKGSRRRRNTCSLFANRCWITRRWWWISS